MVKYEDIKLSPTQALNLYVEKYPNTTVKEVELEAKSKSYVYKVSGYDAEKEYKIDINPKSGVITKVTEKVSKGLYTYISGEHTDKIQALVDKTLSDVGTDSELIEYSLEIDDGLLELKVEVRQPNQDDMKFKYNLGTGELIKSK